MAIDDFDFSSAAIIRRAKDGVKRKAPAPVAPVIAPLAPKLTPNEIMASQIIYSQQPTTQPVPATGIATKGKGW